MLWTDKAADKILARHGDAPIVVRDEKTASGRVHVGSMRGVAIHGLVTDVLRERGSETSFLYEINDIDPMDDIPAALDQAAYAPHLGKPLYAVPAPSGAGSFADYYAHEFEEVIVQAGFTPTFYRARDLYESGRMNDIIATALKRADDIGRINREVSGSQRSADALPLSVICEECGKVLTTRAYDFDGETVRYICSVEPGVAGSVGCGHEGRVSPFDGRAKFPWKVDWAAKWKVLGVSVEGAGKDHSTKGGARDVANHISREVFGYEPPYDIPYEFFLVGGAKMSSSKGRGSSAADIAILVPPKVFRLVLGGTKPMRAINLDPAGDTIPQWYDWYDTIAGKYWDGVDDDDARLFVLVHAGDAPGRLHLPRFSTVAFLVQMPHIQIEEEVARMKGAPLDERERAELSERAAYARAWLSAYAPDTYRFEIQETLPAAVRDLTDEQRTALGRIRRYIADHNPLDGAAAHAALHDIRKELNIAPQEFFGAVYLSILGKPSGPKAGWFLSVLDREFLLTRLDDASRA